jgi:beta-galactosidase
MNRKRHVVVAVSLLLFATSICFANSRPGQRASFNQNWRFQLGEVTNGQDVSLNDSKWRQLDLPHDWSIEGEFSEKHPAGTGGGALPGGVGWYRKSFTLPAATKGTLVYLEFDGV